MPGAVPRACVNLRAVPARLNVHSRPIKHENISAIPKSHCESGTEGKPDDLLQVLRGPMVLWTSGVPASDTVNILWAFNIDGR